MKDEWWKRGINERVFIIDKQYGTLIKSICGKTLRTYPPVPLEKGDLYNEILYMLAIEIYFYNGKIPIHFFISQKSKFMSKNKCRLFLSRKHKILNNFIPLEESRFKVKDSLFIKSKINIKKLNFGQRKVLTYLYLKKLSKQEVMKKLELTKKELNGLVNQIKSKTKIE